MYIISTIVTHLYFYLIVWEFTLEHNRHQLYVKYHRCFRFIRSRQMYLQKGYINWRPFIIKMLAR